MFGLGVQEFICLGIVGFLFTAVPFRVWLATRKPNRRDRDEWDDDYED